MSVTVPLLAVALLDHISLTPYAAFGAFTSVYARHQVHRARAAMQLGVGLALVTAVVAGAMTAAVGAPDWLVVSGGALVAAAGTAASTALEWRAPGPLFVVLAYATVASGGGGWSDVPWAIAVTAGSAAFAIAVANLGLISGRHTGPAPPRPTRTRSWEPIRSLFAVASAGSIAAVSGRGHPDWAMVAAVAPLSAAGLGGQLLRAGHRMVGTTVGLLGAAPLLGLELQPVPRVLVVAVLLVGAELVVARNYGLAMLFITPLALLMGQLSTSSGVMELLVDRGVQTAIGGLSAVAVVLVGQLWRRRAPSPRQRQAQPVERSSASRAFAAMASVATYWRRRPGS